MRHRQVQCLTLCNVSLYASSSLYAMCLSLCIVLTRVETCLLPLASKKACLEGDKAAHSHSLTHSLFMPTSWQAASDWRNDDWRNERSITPRGFSPAVGRGEGGGGEGEHRIASQREACGDQRALAVQVWPLSLLFLLSCLLDSSLF